MHWDSKKHPRHTENGRFREKSGAPDLTTYAMRIEAKIAASRGESKSSPAKKATPRKSAPGKAPSGRPASVAAVKKAYHASGADTKAKTDAALHPKLNGHSVEQLRAIRKKLAAEYENQSPGSLHNPAIADSIARLIEKKTG